MARTPPWQALYDRVRVVRNGSRVYAPPPTDAELDALAAGIGSPLPESYRAWMKRFGGGELQGWVRLEPVVARPGRARDGVLERTATMRRFMQETIHTGSLRDWFAGLVFFASSGGGDHYAWHPMEVTKKKPHECRFYRMDHGSEDEAEEGGDSFWHFVERTEADIASWEREPGDDAPDELSFGPLYLRPKKSPVKRDIQKWLAHDSHAILHLALALRADPRPAEFGVLADALEEAGCDCADLLASCRPGAHDEDRAWALEVLLGKAKQVKPSPGR